MTYGRFLEPCLKHFGQARANGSAPVFTEWDTLALRWQACHRQIIWLIDCFMFELELMNTKPDGTEANAAVRGVCLCACAARESKRDPTVRAAHSLKAGAEPPARACPKCLRWRSGELP